MVLRTISFIDQSVISTGVNDAWKVAISTTLTESFWCLTPFLSAKTNNDAVLIVGVSQQKMYHPFLVKHR